MKILTCNIRCAGADDGDDSWTHRGDYCASVIRSQNPDLIGFQEMWAEQFRDLSAALPDYRSFGMIDEPTGRNPTNCIFYRREAFRLVSAGGYWLSEHPHVTGSKSWNSACVRLANWVRLEDLSTGIHSRLINTHLDHIGQEARERQAALICEDTRAYPDDFPQFLTGDMNCDASNPAIASLKAAGWVDTFGHRHGTEDPGHTYHEFRGPEYRSEIGKMDWVFWRGNVDVMAAAVIDESNHGRFPSDHYFVSATVQLQCLPT